MYVYARPNQTDNDTTLSQLLDSPATFLSNDRQEQRDKRLQAVAKQKVWVEWWLVESHCLMTQILDHLGMLKMWYFMGYVPSPLG